ncbi:peptide-methionine (S)-S-oxide reductase MsrA [Neolewinella agarilytica]|uniref:Peptide methionine sulfoxide reductase MsrA n=1 Tax=Neolewinella agarilytica TaxID=478744 RepID=A0A1H9G2D2_9BACT|nr:peptide-methionine (S)-S-oxide reductase MsrA [Neolewinella agarilytica]SEQ44315.1 peptide-methionine (S)-S-oxide reductase [Neolewinella agarilytica]
MKSPALTFLLLLGLIFSSSACDSQKTNASAGSETTAMPDRKGNPEPVAGITIQELDKNYEGLEKAYLAGGCFWCTEAALDRIQGVVDVHSGYAGGKEVNPTYKEVSAGKTSHAEAIVVYYDPAVIDYNTVLDVFFVAHDPTQVNRQGPDVGPHYRSAIFPINEEQRMAAEAKIGALNQSGKFSKKIATTIEDPIEFYLAEAYHQDYYEDPSNPNQGYVQNVSRPKVEKVMKVFKDRLKPEFLK